MIWLRRVVPLLATAGVVTLSAAAPAQAAVPDRFGFVLFDGAAPVPSGTFPPSTTVTAGTPGRYRVVFPGQGANGGVVHVTAVNPSPHWCQVDAFGSTGTDEIAILSCYRPGGAADPSAFSAVFDSSSGPPTAGGRFGYVDSLAGGTIVSQYNSSLLPNSVAHVAVGQWQVNLPGLGTGGPLDGGLQVTAVSPGVAARCKVAKWTSFFGGQQALVYCFSAAGLPFDTRFTLTFQFERALTGGVSPPRAFGYLLNRPPLGPVSTNFNSIRGPGANTVTPVAVGRTLVRLPSLGVLLPDDVQVTAAGPNSDFCGLTGPWVHASGDTFVPYVACFANAGYPVDTGFLLSATSAS